MIIIESKSSFATKHYAVYCSRIFLTVVTCQYAHQCHLALQLTPHCNFHSLQPYVCATYLEAMNKICNYTNDLPSDTDLSPPKTFKSQLFNYFLIFIALDSFMPKCTFYTVFSAKDCRKSMNSDCFMFHYQQNHSLNQLTYFRFICSFVFLLFFWITIIF